jgi:hypothetical protein
MATKRMHLLPSAAWVNGGNVQIPVKDLPALGRVRAFVFCLEAVFTTGAAAAAIPSTQLHRLVSMIDCGPFVRASGMFWRFLDWMTRGGETALPAGIPATNASTFRRNISWVVPFFDKRAAYPADDLPAGASFLENVINIDCASFASLDGGTNTWNTLASVTGTLRAYAIVDEPNDAPGALVKFGFADLTGQSPNLDPGLYTDLFIYRENGNTIDSAQVASIAVQVDGAQYCDNLKVREYAFAYDQALALGGDYEAASATAPIAGELLTDQPSTAAGAVDTVTNPVIPVIFQPFGYKKAGCLIARNNLRLDIQGTDTSFRVGYRKVLPRSEADMVTAFHRIGRFDVASTAQIAAKTGSKRGLSSRSAGLAPYLPLRALKSR